MRWAVLLLIALAAGCLDADSPSVDYGRVSQSVEEAARPFLSQDHGDDAQSDLHHQAALHAASRNLERVGYHNGVDNTGNPNSIQAGVYYTELALSGQYVFLARGSTGAGVGQSGPIPQHGGFVIIDVADPARPRFVSEFNALTGSDIEVSADGSIAFFGTQRNTVEEMVGNVGQSQDPGDGVPRGIHIVDVRDKHEPVEIAFHPVPYNGPHTLTYFQHGARELLIVQTYDFYANTVPSSSLPGAVTGALGGPAGGVFPVTQRVTVYEVVRMEGEDLQVSLVQVGHFQRTDTPQDGRLFFPHDVSVQVHPLRAKTYLYVAYWDLGVRIVDISDLPGADTQTSPMLPEVGAFGEFSPSALDAIHLAKPFEHLIDGRHITVAEPEIIAADETGYITFIDTSTPGRPEKPCATSWWTLPGDLTITNNAPLMFSPHNFDTFQGKVALAHNHAGLWVIDVGSQDNLCEPKSVGFTMDVLERTDAPRPQPYFWGVFEQDGLLFASDEASGLYILRYTGP